VCEYKEQHYLPGASAYRARAADKGAIGVELVNRRRTLEKQWAALRFGEVKLETEGEQHVFKCRCISTISTRRQCRPSFMPMVLTVRYLYE
jgi:hypothetical protein